MYGSNANHASLLFLKENPSLANLTDYTINTHNWIKNVKCIRHKNILSIIGQSKQRILYDWSVKHYPLFLSTMDMPISSWDLQKAKFIRLLLDTESFLQKNQSFVVGFSGSSVTAGHGDDSIVKTFSRFTVAYVR
jgi:hypothetical protein